LLRQRNINKKEKLILPVQKITLNASRIDSKPIFSSSFGICAIQKQINKQKIDNLLIIFLIVFVENKESKDNKESKIALTEYVKIKRLVFNLTIELK